MAGTNPAIAIFMDWGPRQSSGSILTIEAP